MANLYVSHLGSNTSPYDTWAKAATAYGTAVTAAAANDTIYVAHDHSESFGSSQTYTHAAGVRVFCADRTSGEPPTTLATTAQISATWLTVELNNGYIYGMSFRAGTSSLGTSLALRNTTSTAAIFQNCKFTQLDSTGSALIVIGGGSSETYQGRVTTIGCSFAWGHTGQGLQIQVAYHSIGDDFVSGVTVPSTLFKTNLRAKEILVCGGDMSDVSGTLFGSSTTQSWFAQLWACKLHASVTPFSPADERGNVYLFDCASGDTHYNFAHYCYTGTTIAGTSIYPTGGALYDGTNPVSWTVAGNANTSKAKPYYSPWIDDYNATLSAMTPYLEAVRDGSATKYNDDEVWSEWMAKVTAGSTRASWFSERTLLGTASALESSLLGAGDWTGESATAAFMKLRPDASFTPAEIGEIRARIGVAGNHTIIVDPKIRY